MKGMSLANGKMALKQSAPQIAPANRTICALFLQNSNQSSDRRFYVEQIGSISVLIKNNKHLLVVSSLQSYFNFNFHGDNLTEAICCE